MVYVLNKNNNPLMPTKRYAKVRLLLKNNQAKVVNNKPFTIKLLYSTDYYTQPITLGIDSGYTYIGFSALTEKEELINGEVTLLSNMSERLRNRAMYRKQRRSRLRHRKPRLDNRNIPVGWLAPSIQHKYESHLLFINKLKEILPITKMIIEVANFDIQKIKNPNISGEEYQNGEQKDFFNLREYIFHRDAHKCQNPNCKNKGLNPILQVHHIGYYKGDRSNRPGNLTTLCNMCHTPKNHEKGGFLYSWKPKIKTFRESTFMSIVRWKIVNTLKCEATYGSYTKSKRISLNLPKTHFNDAFCIANGSLKIRINPLNYSQVRRNNRSFEKFYDAKYIDIRTKNKVTGQSLFNGRRTRNKTKNDDNLHKYRGVKISKGRRTIKITRYFYQPNDLVKYNNIIFTVKGTHCNGERVMLKENNKSIKVNNLIPYKFNKGISIM